MGTKALSDIDPLDYAKQMTRISIQHRPDENNVRVYKELTEIFARLYERLEPEFTTIAQFRRSM